MPETDDIRWLIGFAQRLSGNAEDGEDLAQDVLVAVADAPAARERGFLAAVTRNLFRMRQRAHGRRQRREQAYVTSPSEVPSEAAVEVAVALRAALDELDDATRALLVARHLEERTAEEIAASLGQPASTIRTRLARARKRVREDLDSRWHGERPWAAIVAVPWSTVSKTAPVGTAASAGALLSWGAASVATVGVAIGCAWAMPDEAPTPTTVANAEPKPVETAPVDARINPDPRREAILRARERRRQSPPPRTEDSEESDPIAEVLDEAFLSLEPSTRKMQSCLDAAPADATGVASVRANVIGEPDAGAVVDTVEILDDAGQPELADCLVEVLFTADFPDPRDIVFHDYVFEANLDTRTLMTTGGLGPGQLLDLLAAFPELEEEVAAAVENDPDIAPEVREELAADPERAADFPSLQPPP